MYGLAMELKSQGRFREAWEQFERVIAQFPDYVPSYLMAGGTLVALSLAADAAAIYRKGIEVATRRGDQHAAGELAGALAEVGS